LQAALLSKRSFLHTLFVQLLLEKGLKGVALRLDADSFAEELVYSPVNALEIERSVVFLGHVVVVGK